MHAKDYNCLQDEEAAIMQRLVWEPQAADLLHGLTIKQVCLLACQSTVLRFQFSFHFPLLRSQSLLSVN